MSYFLGLVIRSIKCWISPFPKARVQPKMSCLLMTNSLQSRDTQFPIIAF